MHVAKSAPQVLPINEEYTFRFYNSRVGKSEEYWFNIVSRSTEQPENVFYPKIYKLLK